MYWVGFVVGVVVGAGMMVCWAGWLVGMGGIKGSNGNRVGEGVG